MNSFQSTTVETVSDNTRSLTETIPQVCEINPSSTTNDDRPPTTANNPSCAPPDVNNMMDPIQSIEASNSQMYSDDICLEGEILLETFVDQQISKAGISTSGCETPRTSQRRLQTQNIRNAGKELRRMADAFELTYEREQVKAKANEIGLGLRTYDEFRGLLSALFNPGGITQSRIIVLFFFCSDVAIRSLKSGFDLFSRFMKWSFQYFAERVCDWVRKHGGWVAVLKPQHIYPRMAVAVAVITVVCVVVYKFVKK